MIQEKDFLYRVPVKTAPITTPRGQIRNPEILVDLEGGEFMHGNILDANSTNKLINQSVKDAVDNKLIESGYVTKDLLEAETSARTKGDEDLSSKIKAEQTRAEGKEKEISDKLAIVDGDSNTEGSFRKAIADVIAAAPEDLDTLKEIADKLAGNDDLHTALNQAITEKADASALANEVTRATGAESGLQAAIATKADAAALSNYVLTAALNQQVDTLNTAISAKQDKPDDGNMFLQVKHDTTSGWFKREGQLKFTHDDEDSYYTSISPSGIYCWADDSSINYLRISSDGIELDGGQDVSGYAFTTNGKTAHIPTRTSELTNDSNFITAAAVDDDNYILQKSLKFGGEQTNYVTIDSGGVALNAAGGFHLSGLGLQGGATDTSYRIGTDGIELRKMANAIKIDPGSISSIVNDMTNLFFIDSSGIVIGDINNPNVKISSEGIKFASRSKSDILTAGGDFINISDLASAEDISSLRVGLSKKQNKITVNKVDVTDIETADITKLRTIVTNLINALSASGLIMETENIE